MTPTHRLARGASSGVVSVALVLALAAVQQRGTAVHAADAPVEVGPDGAAANQPAVRLSPPSGLGFFPMNPSPRCDVLDNFGDPRSGGRRHAGVDIMATLGQEVYAVASGTLTRQSVAGGSSSSLSGNSWNLTAAADGSTYFYAHLSAFAPGLGVGSPVTNGQLIGYVGDTGNAGPGNYHLHFEVHPGGGDAVDPLPLLELPASCRVY